MLVKIKKRSVQGHVHMQSEDQAAEHQVHVAMQMKIMQGSIKFMYPR